MIVGVASAEKEDICRDRFLRWCPLRRHLRYDNVQYPTELALLEDKHLVVQTTVPNEVLLIVELIWRLIVC